jgi:hypothetical protein
VRISEARNALKDLEQETTELSAEDASIQAEEAAFQKKIVRFIDDSLAFIF